MCVYQCTPETVIYDKKNKTTILLPSSEASLYACFDKKSTCIYTKSELKKACSFYSEQIESQELFYDSLSTLIQLNLIEPVE